MTDATENRPGYHRHSIPSRWPNDPPVYTGWVADDAANPIRDLVVAAVAARANLDGARLDGARLDGASLDPIKNDVWAVLLHARAEAPAHLAALRAGQIDGSAYRTTHDGVTCGCLVGSLEIARGCDEGAIVEHDSTRPAERWYLAIQYGHTPATSPIAAITEGWIVEFLALVGAPSVATEGGR